MMRRSSTPASRRRAPASRPPKPPPIPVVQLAHIGIRHRLARPAIILVQRIEHRQGQPVRHPLLRRVEKHARPVTQELAHPPLHRLVFLDAAHRIVVDHRQHARRRRPERRAGQYIHQRVHRPCDARIIGGLLRRRLIVIAIIFVVFVFVGLRQYRLHVHDNRRLRRGVDGLLGGRLVFVLEVIAPPAHTFARLLERLPQCHEARAVVLRPGHFQPLRVCPAHIGVGGRARVQAEQLERIRRHRRLHNGRVSARSAGAPR
jgi:hypothetical protein